MWTSGHVSRREALAMMFAAAWPPPAAAAEPLSRAFSSTDVDRLAELLARAPYVAPDYRPPVPLDSFGYDQYRDIRYRRERALWRNREQVGLTLQFFLASFIYPEPITVFAVEDGVARPIAASRDLFSFGPSESQVPQKGDFAFSGLRVHGPLNQLGVDDEILAFNGASYFRGVGKGHGYGLSARGLAINCGGEGAEEFPRFTTFWAERPTGVSSLKVHALLDSPSLTGAYHFTVRPGSPTIIDIEARLFPRRRVDRVGLAPLTSMFLFDSRNHRAFDDYRSAVHDSDGFAVELADGRYMWRPLLNPPSVEFTLVHGATPRGFGLMQRKRSFSNFLDLEAGYERRPGGWVIPQGDWPAGAVELIELPIGAEWGDNIVCQWRLSNPLEPGSSLRFAYRLAWTNDLAARVRRVADTRVGTTNQRKLFIVDYAPFSGVEEPVGAVVTATAGAASRPIVQRNPHTGGVRCFFSFAPPLGGRADLSAELVGSNGDPNGPVALESERWTYRLIQ